MNVLYANANDLSCQNIVHNTIVRLNKNSTIEQFGKLIDRQKLMRWIMYRQLLGKSFSEKCVVREELLTLLLSFIIFFSQFVLVANNDMIKSTPTTNCKVYKLSLNYKYNFD